MFSTKYCCILAALVLTVKSELFYPKGTQFLHQNDDQNSGEISITTTFPYFNKSFDSLFVNTNGAISFSITISQFTPSRFPLGDGRAIIAPFWADVDIRKTGKVSYGPYTAKTILERASKDVKDSFKEFNKFSASWIFVSTWEEVPFFGSSFQENITNTFQAVLITNGQYSFARFIYKEIKWTTGTASGGNASGLGGGEAECGFNAGDNTHWYSIPNSRNVGLLDLPYTTNVNQPGVWMFRIDKAKVEEGGCNVEGFLTFKSAKDYKVPMLGGPNIVVYGPCFEKTDNIVCKFGNDEGSPGAFVSISDESGAKCTVPAVNFIGKARLTLSRDNGATFPYVGIVYYVSQEDYKVNGFQTNWTLHENKFQIMTVNWNIYALPPKAENIAIEIVQYAIKNDAVTFHSTFLKTTPNVNKVTDVKAKIEIPFTREEVEGGSDIEGRLVSFLRLRKLRLFRTQAETAYEWMWSKVLIWPDFTAEGFSLRCRKWADKESNIVPSKDDPTFIACPPTKEKAMEDDGRFFERMSKENRFFSGNSNYKKNWEICFDARNPSLKNYGQQCCYSTKGQLLLGHEEKGGSFAKMHHDADIPYISHYIYDILPYYDCCIRSNKYCKLYYIKRPSDNGKRYQPPRPAITFGEPHMVTLDGVQYTFNGCGEFIILKTSNNEFMLQGRMEQLNMTNGTSINATVYTAFAMKSNISDTVQIQLNKFGGMDVLVDGDKKDFDEEGTILFSNGRVQKKPNTTKYVVYFANGIAVTVEGARQLLQLMVKVPDQHLGKTSGLLGYFDNDKAREFLLPNGTFLKTSSKAKTLHYEFGLKWAVDANQSLFTYFGAQNHSFFTKPIFVPLLFDYDNLTFTDANLEAESRHICQGNVQCLIDAIATGQPSFALMSRNITDEFKQTLSITRRIDCIPLFPEFAFGQMKRTDLDHGEIQYSFKCNSTFVLDGPDLILCKNGTWNGTKPSCRGCSTVGKNVIVDSISLTGSDEVTYRVSCLQGYALFGPSIVICKGGKPSDNKTACLKECSSIGPNIDVLNVNISDIDEMTYKITCKSGYEMLGSNTIKCRSGEWISNTTRCLKGLKVNAPQQDSKTISFIFTLIPCTLAFVVIVVVCFIVLRRKRVSRKETVSAHGKELQKEEPIGGKGECYRENTAVVLSVLDLSKDSKAA